MTILNGCLGYMPTPESPGRGPAMIMGSTAMHGSAPIDDKLFVVVLLPQDKGAVGQGANHLLRSVSNNDHQGAIGTT